MTFRREYETTVDGERLLYVSVFGELDDHFERTLENDPTIDAPKTIMRLNDRVVYSARVNTELDPVPPKYAKENAYVLNVASNDEGWVVRARLPDRDALIAIRDYFHTRDVKFRVLRLHESDSLDRLAHTGLTEKQLDLLLTALYAGYYDIPRRSSQGDLADQLGVSTSAISKQLRRAVSQLIMNSLNPERAGTHHRQHCE